jgi:dUTPase
MGEQVDKLKEFASLLKAAKAPKQAVVEDLPPVASEITVEPVVEAVPIQLPVTFEQPLAPQPRTFILDQLQRDMQFLKKAFEETRRQPVYQPSYSGGGADNLSNIDRSTKTVTSDYTPTTRDWYIGVDSATDSIVTITLPTAIQNGREYVIKDQSGHAQLTPIRIIGTIDGDPDGAEIRINNGSITLLYHNGWRII